MDDWHRIFRDFWFADENWMEICGDNWYLSVWDNQDLWMRGVDRNCREIFGVNEYLRRRRLILNTWNRFLWHDYPTRFKEFWMSRMMKYRLILKRTKFYQRELERGGMCLVERNLKRHQVIEIRRDNWTSDIKRGNIRRWEIEWKRDVWLSKGLRGGLCWVAW